MHFLVVTTPPGWAYTKQPNCRGLEASHSLVTPDTFCQKVSNTLAKKQGSREAWHLMCVHCGDVEGPSCFVLLHVRSVIPRWFRQIPFSPPDLL
jgi:hypothetical protein